MDKKISLRQRIRLAVQLCVTALTNGYVQGFVSGRIFSGPSKAYCVPGLNCSSCPGALGACPLGSLQAVLSNRNYRFAAYVVGFLLIVGAFFGRFVCGWLCPFGLVQDLLYKIPFVKKCRALPGDRWLRWVKYGLLAGFVILLPLFAVDAVGQGSPWFCKWICPSGTLMGGWPLAVLNEGLRAALGFLFAWKSVLLILLLLLSLAVCRPFCRYLCPLGAIYGLFNPVALYRFRFDPHKCTHCGACQRVCKVDLSPCRAPNSMECIRCGACLDVCPTGALSSTLSPKESSPS